VTHTDLPPESWVPSLPADVRVRRVGGRLLVARRDDSLELDEVGTAIFSQIDGETGVGAIADSICTDYDVDRQMAVADVREFLAQLVDLGFLVWAGSSR
jgi:pyrroloquinoline quinone biosynthesis protein D